MDINNEEQNEIEIDLRELFFSYKKILVYCRCIDFSWRFRCCILFMEN